VKLIAPLGHLTERWRKHALKGDEIAPNYYEAAAFETLKGRVRSGDIAVGGSRRYRAFEGYLLPQAHFDQLASANQTRLAVTNEAQAYLDSMQREIAEKLVALQESIGKVERSLVLDDKGQFTCHRWNGRFPKRWNGCARGSTICFRSWRCPICC
jgi:hypothetical protein